MNHNEPDVNEERTTSEPDQNLLKKIESKNKIIEAKDQTIKNLEHEEGFLIQEHTRVIGKLDRLLMPAPEEIIKKSWWQLWKKKL